MSTDETTVLLTGVGLDGGADIIRGLRTDPVLRARIVGVDASAEQASRHLCDAFHLVPRRDDPDYVESVARIAHAEGARVIYPLPTFDQEIFASAREDLESRGFAVPVSPLEAVRTCNDKWLLYEHLRGFTPEVVPETHLVSSAEQLSETAGALGYPERRVCIRRRVSRGAIGLRVLDAGPGRLTALLHENPGSLLVSLDEVLDCLRYAEPFPEYLVQEYLPGREWDVDVLCRDGESLAIATRRNVTMTAGAAVRSILERVSPISSMSGKIVADLRLNAIVNLSFRSGEDGHAKLLEINPRIPQSVACASAGGVNLVALAVRNALGERVATTEPEWGGQFLRYYRSVVVDASETPVLE